MKAALWGWLRARQFTHYAQREVGALSLVRGSVEQCAVQLQPAARQVVVAGDRAPSRAPYDPNHFLSTLTLAACSQHAS